MKEQTLSELIMSTLASEGTVTLRSRGTGITIVTRDEMLIMYPDVGTIGHIDHGMPDVVMPNGDMLELKLRQQVMSDVMLLEACERRYMHLYEPDPEVKKIVHGPIIKRGKGKIKRW